MTYQDIITVHDMYHETAVASYTDPERAYQRAVAEIGDIVEGQMEEFFRNLIEVDTTTFPYMVSYDHEDGMPITYMLVSKSTLISED